MATGGLQVLDDLWKDVGKLAYNFIHILMAQLALLMLATATESGLRPPLLVAELITVSLLTKRLLLSIATGHREHWVLPLQLGNDRKYLANDFIHVLLRKRSLSKPTAEGRLGLLLRLRHDMWKYWDELPYDFTGVLRGQLALIPLLGPTDLAKGLAEGCLP